MTSGAGRRRGSPRPGCASGSMPTTRWRVGAGGINAAAYAAEGDPGEGLRRRRENDDKGDDKDRRDDD